MNFYRLSNFAVLVQPRKLRLKLWNSLYPHEEALTCMPKPARILSCVIVWELMSTCTEFLPDEEVIQALRRSDLVILPYTSSTESASAAVCLPLASLRPVLCSDLAVFDEYKSVLHRFPRGNVFVLANRILEMSADPELRLRYLKHQTALVHRYSWKSVGVRFQEIMLKFRAYERLQPRPSNLSEVPLP